MSYAYDILASVWAQQIRPKIEDKTLAMLFEELIEAMHSANHRLPMADAKLKGDGINKDPEVSQAARALDEYIRKKS